MVEYYYYVSDCIQQLEEREGGSNYMGNAPLPLEEEPAGHESHDSFSSSESLSVSVSHLLIYLRAPRPVRRGTCTLKGHA